MGRECDYSVAQQGDGGFSLSRTTEPFPGTVALIRPSIGRTGEPGGWRLRPLVTL